MLRMTITKETNVSSDRVELMRLRTRKKEILGLKQGGSSIGNDDGNAAIINQEDKVNEDEDAFLGKEQCLWNNIKDLSMT
jgi:hypothetical protein